MDENIMKAMNTPAKELFPETPELKMEYREVPFDESTLGELSRRFGLSDKEWEIIRNLRDIPDSEADQAANQCIRLLQQFREHPKDEYKK